MLTLSLARLKAPIHNMRIDIPDYRACGQAQSETAGDRARRPDLSLRYSDYEAVEYHRNLSEPQR